MGSGSTIFADETEPTDDHTDAANGTVFKRRSSDNCDDSTTQRPGDADGESANGKHTNDEASTDSAPTVIPVYDDGTRRHFEVDD